MVALKYPPKSVRVLANLRRIGLFLKIERVSCFTKVVNSSLAKPFD